MKEEQVSFIKNAELRFRYSLQEEAFMDLEEKNLLMCVNLIFTNIRIMGDEPRFSNKYSRGVSSWPLLKFQCNWSLRLGCQGRNVKVYVIRTNHNPPFTVPDSKLWVVEVQYSFQQMWRLLITWFVDIILLHAKYKQLKDCKWWGYK